MSLKIFNWIFLLPLWIKFRRLLTGVSCNKMVTLDNLCFFCFIEIISFFRNHTISSTILYVIFSFLLQASAVFAKHWHVPTESPIKKNICYCGTTNFKRKIVMPSLRFVFRINKLLKTSKGPPQYIFTGDKGFRQNFAMPFPCFVQEKFCPMAKRNWNFCKFSDKSFLKLLLWTRNTIFWHRCEKNCQGGRNCFVLRPNMLKEKTFSF